MRRKFFVCSIAALCALAFAYVVFSQKKEDGARKSEAKKARTFQGLRTVIYHVNDLRKAKEWYAKALNVKPYFDEPFYVGFNVGGYELGLDPNTENAPQGASVVAYWGVADAKEAYRKLVAHGAKEREDPREVGGGVIVATVTDPFGNVFGVVENPHFKIESDER